MNVVTNYGSTTTNSSTKNSKEYRKWKLSFRVAFPGRYGIGFKNVLPDAETGRGKFHAMVHDLPRDSNGLPQAAEKYNQKLILSQKVLRIRKGYRLTHINGKTLKDIPFPEVLQRLQIAERPATLRFVDVSKGWIERRNRSKDDIMSYSAPQNTFLRRKSRPIFANTTAAGVSNQEEHDQHRASPTKETDPLVLNEDKRSAEPAIDDDVGCPEDSNDTADSTPRENENNNSPPKKRKSIAAITVPESLDAPLALVSPSNVLNDNEDDNNGSDKSPPSHCLRHCICCCCCRFVWKLMCGKF